MPVNLLQDGLTVVKTPSSEVTIVAKLVERAVPPEGEAVRVLLLGGFL